jgi:predicted transcriptional regulator
MDTLSITAGADPAELNSEELEAERITVKAKWQGAVTDASGFVAVPLVLLRMQAKLRLTPTDLGVLVNLLAHWWHPKRAVFPRTTTIAQRMGVDKRTVQRSTQKMTRAGLIERAYTEDGRRTYQFTALAERLARMVPMSLTTKEGLGA